MFAQLRALIWYATGTPTVGKSFQMMLKNQTITTLKYCLYYNTIKKIHFYLQFLLH